MIATDEINAETLSSPSREVRRCDRCQEPVITAPALQCPQCGGVTRLRCFVRHVDNTYVAECIDLDITAEAGTLEGAIAGLQDAMDGYLGAAIDTNTSSIILRPSPLLHRIRYALEYAKGWIVSALLRLPQPRTAKVYAVPPVPSHCHQQ